MFAVRRFLAVGAFLALTLFLACLHLAGETSKYEAFAKERSGGGGERGPAGRDLPADLAATKFQERPVLTYKTVNGDTMVALQIQPRLDPVPARPRDYLLLVSTSASMGKGNLTVAQTLAE